MFREDPEARAKALCRKFRGRPMLLHVGTAFGYKDQRYRMAVSITSKHLLPSRPSVTLRFAADPSPNLVAQTLIRTWDTLEKQHATSTHEPRHA